MRGEVRVSSPEPAAAVSVTPGTPQTNKRLTNPEIKRMLAAQLTRTWPPGNAER